MVILIVRVVRLPLKASRAVVLVPFLVLSATNRIERRLVLAFADDIEIEVSLAFHVECTAP